MLNNGKTIKIQIGKVNQPVVERIEEEKFLDTAIFGSQYRNMLAMLNRYVKHRSLIEKASNGECVNNIFAFVGERGSGKTSCMSSVSKLLMSNSLKNFISYPELKEAKFATIDIIDPSYFDEHHNIVATMVAKLYKSYQNQTQVNHGAECNFDEERSLIEAFCHAQHSLRSLLEKPKYIEDDFDDIEKLSDLSLAIDLKNDIKKLVDTYLRFVKKEGGVLVLSIDDIDLNLSEADTMAEQIRKYLVTPNIVILFAAKLDQLATIKKLHYAEKYETLIRNHELHFDTIEEMTSQFLTKFVPHDQRVYMPEPEYILDSGIDIDGDNLKGNSVRQAVPELIFNRTRYLFYNSKQTPSYIVPRNLRKLCQFVAMLWTMCPYDDDTTPSTNKSMFRSYLFGSWVQDNLLAADRERVLQVLEGWKNDQLNGASLEVIKDKFQLWIKDFTTTTSNFDKSDDKTEIISLLRNGNREFNISVGDVMSLICLLQTRFEAHSDKCFFFILSTIYSIALYEKYDIITDEQDKDGYEENKDRKVVDDGRVLLFDPFADELVMDYQKLVGGRFFNYRLSPIMPKETAIDGSLVSRSDRMINLESLMCLIEECVVHWKEYNLQPENVDARKILKRNVRLAEFFMLCTIRDISTRNRGRVVDFYDAEFRQYDTVTYNGDYTGTKHVFFDLGSFLYNVTNIRSCYRRFKMAGKEFFDLCYADQGYKEVEDGEEKKHFISLYASFRSRAKYYRGEGYNVAHAWQSWASIRNTEILFDLNQHISQKCQRVRETNRQTIQSYFKALSEYSIRTYDRNDKDGFLQINFEFADSISRLLSDNDIEVLFNNIYDIEMPARRVAKPRTSVMTMPPELLVDTDALLRGRKELRNKKASIIKYLRDKQPQVYNENQLQIRTVFDGLAEYLTKDELKQAVLSLNVLIMSKYGSTQGNSEDPVSSTDSNPTTPGAEG